VKSDDWSGRLQFDSIPQFPCYVLLFDHRQALLLAPQLEVEDPLIFRRIGFSSGTREGAILKKDYTTVDIM
jgi:hypothetical protein